MSTEKNTIAALLNKIRNTPDAVDFKETIDTIDAAYNFTPVKFINGKTVNEAGSNNGSCKIFAFAQLHKLSEQQTLNLFGDYYRSDVLKNPEGSDHANIRNFILSGWGKIEFVGTALKAI